MGSFTRELAVTAGVEPERIIEVPFPTSWRGITGGGGPKSEYPVVACVARLVPEKGIDVLLQAWGSVLQLMSTSVLEVAGDGPERSNLEALARRLALGDAVRFLGWMAPADMPKLYSRAWAVVLPSRLEEGLGMALVEGGLGGCALIGSDLGGIRDIVRPGRNGVLVPPDDPEYLASALLGLLSQPDRIGAYGRAARDDALTYLARREAGLAELRRRVEALWSSS
jgi:glycosyltransferase involved in cell wall biosynthesis